MPDKIVTQPFKRRGELKYRIPTLPWEAKTPSLILRPAKITATRLTRISKYTEKRWVEKKVLRALRRPSPIIK